MSASTEKSVNDYLPARIWLMKSEPDVFSFQDLLNRPGQRETWDGVRNYLARNFMRDEMKVGDTVLFYHSNAQPSGIAGEAEVVGAALADVTALDPKSPYFDPKASTEQPRWVAVTIGKPRPYHRFVSLEQLRSCKELSGMLLLRKGQRLSIQPVSENELHQIRKLAQL